MVHPSLTHHLINLINLIISLPHYLITSQPLNLIPMPHLICYDISNNSLRTKMGKQIIQHGLDRINKSVYLGTISSSSLTNLENKLQQAMQAKPNPTDSLIVISVSATELQAMRIYGKNDLDKAELTGTKNTLIL